LIHYAEDIKKEVNIPVIAVQRINTPELADRVIREGKADLVATGRALIADPHWPVKARDGKLDEIRRCIACNQGCMEKIVMENSLTCLHNPEVVIKQSIGEKEKETRKKILVIGGGLSGMEAAYVLAEKGHDVRLVETADELGGSARVASVLDEKKEFGGVLEFLENQLRKLKVHIKLKEEVNIQGLKKSGFDEIIVATGSTPIVPNMKNLHKKNVIRFAKDVLRNPEGIGKNIIILGGGSVGIEVAEFLHRSGKNVTVIEMLDHLCEDLGITGFIRGKNNGLSIKLCQTKFWS
jgi:NADPH-dependent 2,4-dienoyl-CoA reductase/sulfur reductase-like enzyme